MKIDQYCQRQRCKEIELDQFLACFRVAWVCQRQLGFLVGIVSNQSMRQRKMVSFPTSLISSATALPWEITLHKKRQI